MELIALQNDPNSTVGVILLEVDNFESINERGHQAGDIVLQAVAKRIVEGVNQPDIVARFGNKQFVVATWRRPVTELRDLADSIRSRIGAIPVAVSAKHVDVTVSVGYASTAFVSSTASDSRQILLNAAQAALHSAKNGKRNCAVGWRAESAESHAPHLDLITNETATHLAH